MKARILSLAIAMITLFAFNNAYAQNPHYVKGPCINNRTITATIAGLGTGPIDVVVTGEMSCTNPGGNNPPAWQGFELRETFDKRTGGNFKLNFSLSSLCPNPKWTFRTQNVYISVYKDGVLVLGPTLVEQC